MQWKLQQFPSPGSRRGATGEPSTSDMAVLLSHSGHSVIFLSNASPSAGKYPTEEAPTDSAIVQTETKSWHLAKICFLKHVKYNFPLYNIIYLSTYEMWVPGQKETIFLYPKLVITFVLLHKVSFSQSNLAMDRKSHLDKYFISSAIVSKILLEGWAGRV